MKYGFIGAGNMGGAIMKGMTIGTGKYDPKSIFVTDKLFPAAEKLAEATGIIPCEKGTDVVANADVLVLLPKRHALMQEKIDFSFRNTPQSSSINEVIRSYA